MTKPGNGVVFCVNDSGPYRLMLDVATCSIRRFHTDLPIEVVHLEAGSGLVDTVRWHFGTRAEGMLKRWTGGERRVSLRQQAFSQKAKLFIDPPFERTLFVDCDTIALKPLHGLFERLDSSIDVVIQQWVQGSLYEPSPPFTTEYFRRFNAGVVLFTPALAEVYRGMVKALGDGLINLYEPDQYILSRAIEQLGPGRVMEDPTLQIINKPAANGNQSTSELRDACTKQGEYYFYHYIYKKKASLKAARSWTGL